MKSSLPKVLHAMAGKPMLNHLLDAASAVFDRIVVVTGPEMEAVAQAAAPHTTIVQQERLGTGHAALQAVPHFGDGDVAILYADNPLITAGDAAAARGRAGRGGACPARHAPARARPLRPRHHGRGGRRDAHRRMGRRDRGGTARTTLCNAGVFCAAGADLARWLAAIRNDNAKGEFYLTDAVALAVSEGKRVVAVEADHAELRGINSRAELAEAEAAVQARLRLAAMEAGVTLTAPETVFLSADTVLEPDVTVGPHVVFGPGVTVRARHRNPSLQPSRRLRRGRGRAHRPLCPAASGHDGRPRRPCRQFRGAEGDQPRRWREGQSSRLYRAMPSIGAGTNIGAGTITCNYDGYLKHRTVIGAGSFIGSNATLVAPVTLGAGSFIAAGSTITRDVAADALAFGRARQSEKAGGGAAIRATWTGKKKG